MFADGTTIVRHADGSGQQRGADGAVLEWRADGVQRMRPAADGAGGVEVERAPSGTVRQSHGDGRTLQSFF